MDPFTTNLHHDVQHGPWIGHSHFGLLGIDGMKLKELHIKQWTVYVMNKSPQSFLEMTKEEYTKYHQCQAQVGVYWNMYMYNIVINDM